MTEPQYIESSSVTRAKLFGAGLAAILLGVAYDQWVAPWVRWVSTLPTCESLPWVRLELISGVLICWFIAWASLQQGYATRRLGQTPLPGTWVWSRTKVRTGTYATLTSFGLLALSALFFAGPIVIIIWQKFYLIFCFPHSCGC